MGRHEMPFITNISYNQDGSRILASKGDGSIVVWDVKKCAIVKIFAAHAGGVISSAYSSEGQYILSMGFDGYRKWDSGTASLVSFYHTEAPLFTSQSYSNSGDKILLWSVKPQALNRINLINWSNGEVIWHLEFKNDIIAVFFGQDDKYAALAGREGMVYVVEVNTGKIKSKIDSGFSDMSFIKFSPGYKYLLTRDDMNICLWNFEENLLKYEIKDIPGFIKDAGFVDNAENIRIVTDQGIGTWSTESGKQISFLDLDEIEMYYPSLDRTAFNPDGKTIACYDNGSISIIDIKTGKRVKLLSEHSSGYKYTEEDLKREFELLYPESSL